MASGRAGPEYVVDKIAYSVFMGSGTFWRLRFGASRFGAGHFGAEEGRRTLWRRGKAPDTLAPKKGTNLPKTELVLTLTEMGLNPNRNGS